MFLLNLSLAEFLAIFGAVSGLVTVLYLLDRHRRRQAVPTLKFWRNSDNPPQMKHRRRIQQPWSLLLQLVSMCLLLLAIAQLRFGSEDLSSRDHVLVLDTSAWMGARTASGHLMDEAKKQAKAYVRALPPSDRVMLVRADALATPATAFETDRRALIRSIDASQPGATALNLEQALEFARNVQRMDGRRAGEVVFAGAGRVPSHEPVTFEPPELRVLPVDANVGNAGLRRIGLHRSTSDAEAWEILVTVRNYGNTVRETPLSVNFGGAPIGSRVLRLAPGSEQSATFLYRTRAAGWVEARLAGRDAFPDDDRALLEVPAQQRVRVAVYSDESELLKPVLAANSRLQTEFYNIAQYNAEVQADVIVLDRFRPARLPQRASVWIDPPRDASPVRVRSTGVDIALSRWRPDHPLGAGLRTKGLRLEEATVFEPAPGDISVAECENGPLIVARAEKQKMVVLGFHPMRSSLRYELATPLLFANIVRWIAPEAFRSWELNGGAVGAVSAVLPPDADASKVRVVSDNGQPYPFTIQGRTLRLFAGNPTTVRILAGDRESVHSLSLPDVADAVWQPPARAMKGVPGAVRAESIPRDVWHWLAALGAAGILAEWLLFGRSRRGARMRILGGSSDRPPLRRST